MKEGLDLVEARLLGCVVGRRCVCVCLVTLPSVADTFADSNGRRIWASVFCDAPQNLDESMFPGNSGCESSATFQFENCSSH
jgi:hypothetical protein